jgi:hypothetical protein
MAELNSLAHQERYRAARVACGHRLGHELNEVASDIGNPVVKLRFLRDVIDNHHRLPRSFKSILARPVMRGLLRVNALFSQLGSASRARLTFVANRVLLVVLSCFAFLVTAYSLGTQANTQPTGVIAAPSVVPPPAKVELPATLPLIAESMPTDALGITPTTIWLADRGDNWELYSNGLRIETLYTVAGESRRYRIHQRATGVQPAIHNKPVGILFHTSESDLWPLDAGFDKQLRQSSAALLNYVKEQRAYNYVIDRFGRVYRIVDDETRANHAGNSIWANGDDVYLDLNSAFLGVSFESRWERGEVLPITRAQLIAGRNLTNYLRQRFAIAPEMCATHGLASVSPKQHLIGYHTDWARGFPFAAFGLPDQYALPPASIALFGFSYGDDLQQSVGDGWPGLATADAALMQEAVDKGVTVEVLRAERHALYAAWSKEARSAPNNLIN